MFWKYTEYNLKIANKKYVKESIIICVLPLKFCLFKPRDISGQHAVVTSSDLSTKLQGLTTSDKPSDDPHNQPGSSKSWKGSEDKR